MHLKNRFRALSLFMCAAALLLAGQALALDYPRPRGPVADYAKVIAPKYRQAIEAAAAELWQKTGASVVVATVPSLQGDSIEEAAVSLFQKWGIGKKGEDKGLLILVAIRERKLRIEVGYGLEPVITDAMAGRIRDQALVPFLKKNQYGKGLYAGVAVAAGLVAKAQGVTLTGVPQVKLKQKSRRAVSFGGLALLVVMVLVFSRIFRGRGRRGGGGALLTGMLLGSMMGGMGGHRGGGGDFGGFGGGFGGFGGGMSGGGGASGGF